MLSRVRPVSNSTQSIGWNPERTVTRPADKLMPGLVKCFVPILLAHLLTACDSVDNISNQPEAERFIGEKLCLKKSVFLGNWRPDAMHFSEELTTYAMITLFLQGEKSRTVAQYQALLDDEYSLDKADRALTVLNKIPSGTQFRIEALWKAENPPDVGTYFVPISQFTLPKYGNLRVDVGQLLLDSYSYTLENAHWDSRYVEPCQTRLHGNRNS